MSSLIKNKEDVTTIPQGSTFTVKIRIWKRIGTYLEVYDIVYSDRMSGVKV